MILITIKLNRQEKNFDIRLTVDTFALNLNLNLTKMEIQGRVVDILEPKSGQSARGSWKKHEFIVETDETYPKKICIANWNDKIDLSGLKKGEEVIVSVNVESREYNGNWYTDIKVWKIDKKSSEAGQPSDSAGLPGIAPPDTPPPPVWDNDPGDSGDDLPF